ncbi:MAG TPA: YfhO family protein [Dinghuibacter sp.]|uniref:YfhO family protein n=1 Tax=Dinghuibacter sp. TaxID=2024697 RepID=UPI002BF0760F|nr:YfhO family protein [Dinghuibacter sp.]HTJ14156.1 YfhO family protein [Dinghuibacter sp.]
MNKFNWKKLVPHIVAIAVFLLVAAIYCGPSLQGKVVGGNDVAEWQGAVHQMEVYKSTHGHYPLWSNSMFGGMPGFLIAMGKTNPIPMNYFLALFNLFLPSPASYFFLMCLGFYFLALVLRVNPYISIIGALGYAYASFSAVLILAGHQTEIWAMGYVPFVLGSVLLLYEGKYLWGTALTALFSYLLININHIQIAYYGGIMAVAMAISYGVNAIRTKQYKGFMLASALAVAGGALGVISNAGTLLTNYDYSKETQRNGALTLNETSGKMEKSSGLDIKYAFNWSEGVGETFTLVAPNYYGGGSEVPLPQDGKLAEAISNNHLDSQPQLAQEVYQSFPAYWGEQPSVFGTVYLGAVMATLVIFSLFYLKSKHKWWLAGVTVFAILLSWGSNFMAFNSFMFEHFPAYNKFRSPTMSLVIPQLTFPILAILGLQQLFFGEGDTAYNLARFKKAAIAMGALAVVLIGLYFGSSYRSSRDKHIEDQLTQMAKGDASIGRSIVNAAAADRQAIYGSDLVRTLVFMALAAGILFFAVKGRIKKGIALGALGVLSFIDLIQVDLRYLNGDSYKDPDEAAAVFNPSPASQQILRDTSYYRVMNFAADAFNDGVTSYFHNAIGGYHSAKLALFQDLLNNQLSKQPINMPVYNMLNTKYFIVPDRQTGQAQAQQNPGALGPCWLVKTVDFVDGPAAAMKALDNFNPLDTAVVENSFKGDVPFMPQHDSAATIGLIRNDNDLAWYRSSSTSNEFAVFSEIYYSRGWRAYVDGIETPIVKTDYLLRGLPLKPGKHEIRFEFHPDAYFTGLKVGGIGAALILLLLAGAIVTDVRKKQAAKA